MIFLERYIVIWQKATQQQQQQQQQYFKCELLRWNINKFNLTDFGKLQLYGHRNWSRYIGSTADFLMPTGILARVFERIRIISRLSHSSCVGVCLVARFWSQLLVNILFDMNKNNILLTEINHIVYITTFNFSSRICFI